MSPYPYRKFHPGLEGSDAQAEGIGERRLRCCLGPEEGVVGKILRKVSPPPNSRATKRIPPRVAFSAPKQSPEVHLFELRHFILQRGENLHPLDGVDAQVALECS